MRIPCLYTFAASGASLLQDGGEWDEGGSHLQKGGLGSLWYASIEAPYS